MRFSDTRSVVGAYSFYDRLHWKSCVLRRRPLTSCSTFRFQLPHGRTTAVCKGFQPVLVHAVSGGAGERPVSHSLEAALNEQMAAREKFAFVLFRPAMGGNSRRGGASAQNMGFDDLRLVAPGTLKSREAAAMAVHADDVLRARRSIPIGCSCHRGLFGRGRHDQPPRRLSSRAIRCAQRRRKSTLSPARTKSRSSSAAKIAG